jgi:hypothetical protein
MNAVPPASLSPMTAAPTTTRVPMLAVLRGLLLGEGLLALGLTIFLSLLAAGQRDFLGGDLGRAAEVTLRFAAAGSFVFAVFAAIAARGARRRRAWAWTMAAILQVVLAIGTGVAVMTADWHPVYLVGFGLAVVVMLVLSSGSVRRALGQA